MQKARVLFLVLSVLALALGTNLPANSQVPFSDNFEIGPRLVHVSPGSWRVVDGALQSAEPGSWNIFSEQANWVVLSDPSWQTYQVELDFRLPLDQGTFAFASHVSYENSAEQGPGSAFVTVLAVQGSEFNTSGYLRACGEDLRGGVVNFPPYFPGWHHLVAHIFPDSIRLFVDGLHVSSMRALDCRQAISLRPETFGFGSEGLTVQVDNLRVGTLEHPVEASEVTWGRIKADRR